MGLWEQLRAFKRLLAPLGASGKWITRAVSGAVSRSSLGILLLLLGTLAAGLPGLAAVPVSGVLSGADAPVHWSGGPFTSVADDSNACTELSCDIFYFTLNVPSSFFAVHANHEVRLRIAWPEAADEFDLYLFDGAGRLLASSVEFSQSFEEIDAGPLANGTYKVVIVAAQTVNASYQGTVLLGEDPLVADGRARYLAGEMTFGPPFPLVRPVDRAVASAFADQNVEPRVVHDPPGNLYVAAVRGIPGIVDLWKSYDTGKTFTYLGPPEGLEDLATRATADNGRSGGEEDLAVGRTGNVYLNLLCWGATIQASSFSGGGSWVVNPLPTEISRESRQWIAAAASNTVYLTYEERESVGDRAVRLVVAKSTDGGITFPQVTPVTTAEGGLQPGEQGNLVVDPANGNVYNVFFDRTGSRLYLARSTDDGLRFELFVVHQGVALPAGVQVFPFPSIAVDGGGNLHVVFSDGVNTYLTTSQNAGASWSHLVRVNNGATTRTSIQPWVMAGDPGKVDITWLGSSVTNSLDDRAEWQVFLAQSQDDFASLPVFRQTTVTGVIHSGPVCVNRGACAPGTRTLAEYGAPDVYLDGNALIVYPDDQNSGLPSGNARAWFVRQTGGPTIIQTVR